MLLFNAFTPFYSRKNLNWIGIANLINQPTVLMRRACEVAVGSRPRQKPFVESSYILEADQECHKYVSEDERGNCCYHFEKKKTEPSQSSNSDQSYLTYPHYGDHVSAKVIEPPKNFLYYCC